MHLALFKSFNFWKHDSFAYFFLALDVRVIIGSAIIGSTELTVNFPFQNYMNSGNEPLFFSPTNSSGKTVRSFKRDTWNLSLGDSCTDKWTVNRGYRGSRATRTRSSFAVARYRELVRPYRNFFLEYVWKKALENSTVRDEQLESDEERAGEKGREMKHVWTVRAA